MNSCDNCKGPAPLIVALASTATGAIVEIRWCDSCGCVYVRNADGWDIHIPTVSASRDPPDRELGSWRRLSPRKGRVVDFRP